MAVKTKAKKNTKKVTKKKVAQKTIKKTTKNKNTSSLQKSIHNIVVKQRQFHKTGATKNIKFRIEALKKLEKVIDAHEQDLYDALKRDFQKCNFESFVTEFAIVKLELSHFIKKLKKWAKPQKIKSNILNYPSKDSIVRDPYGVALIIGPWNYPYQLILAPLIGAIGAGNCSVLKPSELTPKTSSLIRKMISEAFNPEYIAVVEGEIETSQALLEERFDFIFFTGSTNVGRVVQQAAAKHLTPTILELGGKSPCIVEKSANIAIAAKRIAWGKFLNGGQTCVAPDYIFVDASIKEKFTEKLTEVIEKFYSTNPQNSDDFPRIINRKNFDRLVKMIDKKNVIHGGDVQSSELFISPTLIDNVQPKDKIMQQEIFGPMLPIMTYDKLDDVIDYINDNEKPLALYIFTEKNKIKRKILQETSSGDVAINDTVSHLANPNIPFGGVGQSGMGFYHGKASFEGFSHKKGVLDKATWYDNPLRYPPYTKSKLRQAKFLFKLIAKF